MTLFAHLSHLGTADHERLRAVLDRYTRQPSLVEWNQLATHFERLLPSPGDPLRPLALQNLVWADLRKRWEQGDRVLLDRYLQELPELGGARKISPELVRAEYQARLEFGEDPPLESYRERFPSQFAELHLAVSRGAGTLDAPPASSPPQPMPTAAAPEAISREEPTRPAAPRDVRPASSASKGSVAPVGGYELRSPLGRGNFGEVWRAEAPGGVEVAIKLIPWRSGDQLSQYELRALELMKRLRHPYLLQIQASWQQDDQLVIAMELADGSLEDRRKQCAEAGMQGVPVPELLRYMRESAEALDYLHAEQVLHRDIKPGNILVVSGHAKVGDFGIARLLGQEKQWVTATFVGTPRYMAPEVWGNRVTPQSDQYSLASTYVELRLNRPVFESDSMLDAMRKHLEGKPDLEPLPPAEQKVLLKALAKKPEHRYRTCSEFVEALDEALAESLPSQLAERASRRRFLGATLALAAAGLTGGLFWLIRPTSPDPLPRPFQIVTLSDSIRITAGKQQALLLALDGVSSNEAELRIARVPDGVRTERFQALGDEDEIQQKRQDRRQARLDVDLNARPGTYPLVLEATYRGETAKRTLDLIIEAPEVVTIEGFAPAEGSRLLSATDGRIYYDRLVSEQHPDCFFRCLPRSLAAEDIPTFYMMEREVWNGLFQEFVQAEQRTEIDEWRTGPTLSDNSVLQAEEHPQLPVVNVWANEAEEFARWLGGSLPTDKQWWKAAGYFDFQDEYSGPYQSPSVGTINRADKGPNLGGADPADVSPFGIQDMAGNVRELVRAPEEADFLIRGAAFDNTTPYGFDKFPEREAYVRAKDIIGFRVVLDPKAR